MTVAQTGLVDWLGIEKGTDQISLTIVDDLDWGLEQDHLLLLQEKLNTYLAFVESGEVFDRLDEEVGRQIPRTTPIRITILAQFELTARPQAFLNHASEVFRNAGFTLVHRVIETP